MIRVGVIGYGYWGPNIVRNLHGLEFTRLEMVCDKSPRAWPACGRHIQASQTVFRSSGNFYSPEIDAVAVVTPVWTHYESGQKGPRKRQARVRRKAIYFQFGPGGGTD